VILQATGFERVRGAKRVSRSHPRQGARVILGEGFKRRQPGQGTVRSFWLRSDRPEHGAHITPPGRARLTLVQFADWSRGMPRFSCHAILQTPCSFESSPQYCVKATLLAQKPWELSRNNGCC